MLPGWLQSDKGKIILGVLLVFVPITVYALHFPFYQNCLNLRSMMIIYALAGIILGALGAYLLKDRTEELIQTFQLYVAGIILGLFLVPLLATLINRTVTIGQAQRLHPEIMKVEEYYQSRFGELGGEKTIDGVFIYTLIEAKIVRLDTKKDFDRERYSKGSIIPINIHKGLLGLKWARLDLKNDPY